MNAAKSNQPGSSVSPMLYAILFNVFLPMPHFCTNFLLLIITAALIRRPPHDTVSSLSTVTRSSILTVTTVVAHVEKVDENASGPAFSSLVVYGLRLMEATVVWRTWSDPKK